MHEMKRKNNFNFLFSSKCILIYSLPVSPISALQAPSVDAFIHAYILSSSSLKEQQIIIRPAKAVQDIMHTLFQRLRPTYQH